MGDGRRQRTLRSKPQIVGFNDLPKAEHPNIRGKEVMEFWMNLDGHTPVPQLQGKVGKWISEEVEFIR